MAPEREQEKGKLKCENHISTIELSFFSLFIVMAYMKKNVSLSKLYYLLIAIRADSRRVIIFCTIIVRTVIEGAVTLSDRASSSLVLKMPIKTDEGTMLVAFMLQKRLTLFDTELFQISAQETEADRPTDSNFTTIQYKQEKEQQANAN